MTSEPDPLVGRIIGAYRILAPLGKIAGLAGYLAEHVHLDRRVLLKLFHPALAGGQGTLARASDQARDLSAFKHEGALPLVEIAECGDGFVYVVLELSGAIPLSAWIAARGALPWAEVRALGRQIAATLRAAEASALAGTEVDPGRIYVSMPAGREPVARIDLATSELLGIGAPTQPMSQVHALGRLLYFMLTGHEPASTGSEPPADLMLGWPELEIPSNADALVMRAIDPDPANRWADLGVLYRELGGREHSGEGPTPLPQPRAPSRAQLAELDFDEEDVSFGRRVFTRPSRRALLSGAVASGAAIVLGGVLLVGRCQRSGQRDLAAAPATERPPPPRIVPASPPAPLAVSAPPTPPPIPVPAPAPTPVASGDAAPELPLDAAADPPSGAAPEATANPVAPAEVPRPTSPGAPSRTGTAVAEGCRVSLESRPWSEVWVDGRRAGTTPLVDLSIACGKHDLRFLSRAANVERQETITLREGQPVKKVVTLVEGE